MTADRKMTQSRISGFSDGVNNVVREHELPTLPGDEYAAPTAARDLLNVDIMAQGRARRRKGYTKLLGTTNARALYAHNDYLYFVEDGYLARVHPLSLDKEIIAPVSAASHVSFESLNGVLHVAGASGNILKVADDGTVSTLAAEKPAGQPLLAADTDSGNLPAGEYQVAIAYLRGREESGTMLAGTVTLNNKGSILLSSIPQPDNADITKVRVYITRTSSEKFYQHSDIEVGMPGLRISNLPKGKELEYVLADSLPAGKILRAYRGRLYSAIGPTLVYSHPLNYGLTRLNHNYIQYDDEITMVRPVDDGIYLGVGRDKKMRTFFLSGSDPTMFETRMVYPNGVVFGSDTLVASTMLDRSAPSVGNVAVWWATNGVMVKGYNGGRVEPVREGELSLNTFATGATLPFERDGVRQIVSVLSSPQKPSSLAVSDSISIEINRNDL